MGTKERKVWSKVFLFVSVPVPVTVPDLLFLFSSLHKKRTAILAVLKGSAKCLLLVRVSEELANQRNIERDGVRHLVQNREGQELS